MFYLLVIWNWLDFQIHLDKKLELPIRKYSTVLETPLLLVPVVTDLCKNIRSRFRMKMDF